MRSIRSCFLYLCAHVKIKTKRILSQNRECRYGLECNISNRRLPRLTGSRVVTRRTNHCWRMLNCLFDAPEGTKRTPLLMNNTSFPSFHYPPKHVVTSFVFDLVSFYHALVLFGLLILLDMYLLGVYILFSLL